VFDYYVGVEYNIRMLVLILVVLVLWFLLGRKESYVPYHETHLGRKYWNYYWPDYQARFAPVRYRWNYGPGYHMESRFGKISQNYEPDGML